VQNRNCPAAVRGTKAITKHWFIRTGKRWLVGRLESEDLMWEREPWFAFMTVNLAGASPISGSSNASNRALTSGHFVPAQKASLERHRYAYVALLDSVVLCRESSHFRCL
jgi:hypothetical protein